MFGLGSVVHAEPVEAVIGLDVENPGAFVSAMDNLFASGAMDAYQLSLWANVFDGSNPATHTIVARFDSYEDYESLTQQRLKHPGWLRFGLAVSDLSETTSTGLTVELLSEGEVRDDHRSGVAFIMSVSDPGKYAAAFARLSDAVENPGSLRLVQLRYGGMGATHAAVMSAPNSMGMNEYLDELLSSDAYAEFVAEVGDIRTIRTVNNYGLVKRWGD